MNLLDMKYNEEKLMLLQSNILNRITLLDKDKRRISHPHPESADDQAASIENDEVVDRLDERGRVELQHIVDALQKIKVGTYGICVTCEDEIGAKRLKAMPYASKCIMCASD